MNHTATFRDIERMKATFLDHQPFQQMMDNLEERLKNAVDREELANHPIIQELVQNLRSQVAGIKTRLETEKSDTLSEKQRDGLIDLKRVYEKLISTFMPPTDEISNITRSIEEIKEANNIV